MLISEIILGGRKKTLLKKKKTKKKTVTPERHADINTHPPSPVDLVSGVVALLVPLRSLRELQGLVEGPFIGQQPAQGAGGAVALPGGGRGGSTGGPGGPGAAAAEPDAESRPLP